MLARGILLVGSALAVGAALVATAGLTSPAVTQVLLASAAIIALAVTAGSKERT